MHIPPVSLVHYCRFSYLKTKTKTCIHGAKRLATEVQGGGKQGHRGFRKGRQTHAVQAGTQANIPYTF